MPFNVRLDCLEVLHIQQRERLPIGSRAHDRERDQAIRLGERQRADQDGVDEGEHRGIRADCQREHRDDACGKNGLSPQAANGLPEIAERHVRRLRPSRATMKLIVFIKMMKSASWTSTFVICQMVVAVAASGSVTRAAGELHRRSRRSATSCA